MKVNDFFCGAGGMGLGFKYAGFRLAGAWDFDKYAVESYRHNVSPIVKQADITQMTWDEIPYADVWTFGFPCQDISVAGKQAGMVKGKTRSGLFYEVMRLLEETETHSPDRLPTVILAENVKAVKKYLPEIEKEYKARGYRMYATLYNSKYWGVPQNRERYFMIGIHESIEEEFVFPEQQTDFIPKLSSVLEDEVDEKYYIDNEKAKKVIEQAKKRVEIKGIHACITPDRVNKRQNGRRAKAAEEEMFTLTAQDRHGVIDVVGRLDIKGQDNIRRVYNPEGIAPTLTTSEGGNRQPKILEIIFDTNQGAEFKDFADQSQCLLARDYKGFGNQAMNAVIDRFRVRRLTPREYARLQGFPDSYKQVVSNTQFYKQMGNAVTVNVAQAIATKIKEFLLKVDRRRNFK